MRPVLLASLLLAGCVGLGEPPGCAEASLQVSGARTVSVDWLNDGNLSGRLCVKVGESGPLDARLERSRGTPNVGDMGTLGVNAERIEVDAWMAGEEAHTRASFDWEDGTFLVVITQNGVALRIDQFREQPVFS